MNPYRPKKGQKISCDSPFKQEEVEHRKRPWDPGKQSTASTNFPGKQETEGNLLVQVGFSMIPVTAKLLVII